LLLNPLQSHVHRLVNLGLGCAHVNRPLEVFQVGLEMLVLFDHLIFVWMLLDDIKLVALDHFFKLLFLLLKLSFVIYVLLLRLL
jgi:hypothetical protein